MKELQQILNKIDSLSDGEDAVLATVVDVKGSSYRLPGAKMLILADGEAVGTVSGGCLEADVMRRAENVLQSTDPEIFTYDTTVNDDSVFGFNMGCRGVIRILLEPVINNPHIAFLRRCFREERGVSATLIKPSNGGKIAGRLFVDKNGASRNGLADKSVERQARDVMGTGVSCLRQYSFGEVFFEFIEPPVRILIFGAGADAVPLSEIAKEIGWHVTIVDHREALANNQRFRNADQIIISRPEDIGDKVQSETGTAAVIMTHNYEHDKIILENLFERDLRYIGMLGPKSRTDGILGALNESGCRVSERDKRRLHGPVGLDIGAQLPETIAVSIIAEIQSVLAGRYGGYLRKRKGSIYRRNENAMSRP